jgi:MoaA/NifB/PqqE/SkfB family radical SAM enzyme
VAKKLGHFHKHDLDIDHLYQFLDCDAGKRVSHFALEGNHGDSIYYPQLFDFIDRFRDTKTFTIVTNGSYKDKKFWHELASRLTNKDLIMFSIDGLEHNHHVYRQNSDWATTMLGVKTVAEYPVQLAWKTLIFDYNYQEINQIQQFAESMGAKFISEITSRFGDEKLRPPQHLVDHTREYQNKKYQINPQCQNNEREYISADGYYWPCCWISSGFTLYKSELWKNRAQWSIKNQTLDQARQQLQNWIKTIQPDTAEDICQMMCKSDNSKLPNNHGLT